MILSIVISIIRHILLLIASVLRKLSWIAVNPFHHGIEPYFYYRSHGKNVANFRETDHRKQPTKTDRGGPNNSLPCDSDRAKSHMCNGSRCPENPTVPVNDLLPAEGESARAVMHLQELEKRSNDLASEIKARESYNRALKVRYTQLLSENSTLETKAAADLQEARRTTDAAVEEASKALFQVHLLGDECLQLRQWQKRANEDFKCMESRTAEGYLQLKIAATSMEKKESDFKVKEEELKLFLHQLVEEKKLMTCKLNDMRHNLKSLTAEVKNEEEKAFNLRTQIPHLRGKALQAELELETRKVALRQLAEQKESMAAELAAMRKALSSVTSEVNCKEKQASDLRNLILQGKALQSKLEVQGRTHRQLGVINAAISHSSSSNSAPRLHLTAASAASAASAAKKKSYNVPAVQTPPLTRGTEGVPLVHTSTASAGSTSSLRTTNAPPARAAKAKLYPPSKQQTVPASAAMVRAAPGQKQSTMSARMKVLQSAEVEAAGTRRITRALSKQMGWH